MQSAYIRNFVALQSYVKALINPSIHTLSSVMNKINIDTYHYKQINSNEVKKFEILNIQNENKIINFDVIFLPAGKTIFEKIDRQSVVKPLFNNIKITYYNNELEVPFKLNKNDNHIFQSKSLYSLRSESDNIIYKFSLLSLENYNKYYNVRYGCGVVPPKTFENGRNFSIVSKQINYEDDDGYYC